MTWDFSSTRRGFLAAAGGTFLAGCSSLQFSDDSRTSIPSHQLPDVTDDGESEPILVDAIPVEIEGDQLGQRLRRATDLLETLPVPLSSENIPNGYVRHRLIDAAHDATNYMQDARTAQTRLTALQSLRRAREDARFAAAGWAFVANDQTREALQEEHRQALSAGRSVQSDHEYLGIDPVRAALVHARIERNLTLILDDRPPSHWESSSLLSVAEWGADAESTRALVDDTRYLYRQYTASLPDDAGNIEETLSTAAETLGADLRARRRNLPPEPTDMDEDLAARLRYRLRDEASSRAKDTTETDGPARAVLTATEGLTNFLAHDRIQRRIEDGEQFRVEDASGVRRTREQALEAIRAAFRQSTRPELARPVLADAAAAVSYADEELARYHGDVRIARLNDPLRRYIIATVRARSVPTASQQVVDALTN